MIVSRRLAPRYRYALIAAFFALPHYFFSYATASASTTDADVGQARSIAFYHTHTGERLEVVYFSEGHYSEAALNRINHFLRDFRTGDEAVVDPATLDIVHDVQQSAGFQGEVHIVSAYRSEKTNEMLRQKTNGVAKKSQHIEGKAIDFRLPGIDTTTIRDSARGLKRGGVGYYKQSECIHVDSGRVRYW